jgi:hypothetical protein
MVAVIKVNASLIGFFFVPNDWNIFIEMRYIPVAMKNL